MIDDIFVIVSQKMLLSSANTPEQRKKALKSDGNGGGAVALPLRASEAVFNELCRNWRNAVNCPGLRPFFDGDLFPISTMDLSSINVTARVFVKLLATQQRNLTCLNLFDTKVVFLCFWLSNS